MTVQDPYQSPEVANEAAQSSALNQRILKVAGYLGGLLLLVLMMLNIVGIVYIRRVENQPLNNPIRVIAIKGDKLQLEDGRSVEVYHATDPWFAKQLQKSGNLVELQPLDDGRVDVYGMRETFICGTCFPPITIPLIPQTINRYQRTQIEFMATVEPTQP